MTDPTLAVTSLPAGTDGYRVPRIFRVEGGLHYIRGNAAPHFSLTYTAHRKGFPEQAYSGGAGHDEILRRFPRFADLAALHLSDIDGVPMHAEANGWYWLAGSMGGAGERYHGGSSTPARDAVDCLAIFARYVRITLDEAAMIRRRLMELDPTEARAEWDRLAAAMRPRWKLEAEAAIVKHGLRVYGDPWPGAARGTLQGCRSHQAAPA